jgi:hypothetical protein
VSPRRFDTPWSFRELEQTFRIEDVNGQAVAYTYFRKDENKARQANVLTWDKARRIAAKFAAVDRRADALDQISGNVNTEGLDERLDQPTFGNHFVIRMSVSGEL